MQAYQAQLVRTCIEALYEPRGRPGWGHQLYLEVSERKVSEVDLNLDKLRESYWRVQREGPGDRGRITDLRSVGNRLADPPGRHTRALQRWRASPSLRHIDRGPGVDHSEAVLVVEVIAVLVAAPVLARAVRPSRVAGVVLPSGCRKDQLHVAPRKVRIGAAHKRRHARDDRSCRGRSSELLVVAVGVVRGDYALMEVCEVI